MGWVLCTDCHRVLQIQHGPTCPECLAKRLVAMGVKQPEEVGLETLPVDEEETLVPPAEPEVVHVKRGRKPKDGEPLQE